MFKSLVLLAVLVAVHAWDAEKCPKLMGKKPFDSTKFVGQWYIVYGTQLEKHADKETKCIKFDIFSQNTDGQLTISNKMTYKLDDEVRTGEAFSQPKKSDDMALFYGVHKLQEDENWSPVFKKAIIATDYENYAAFVSCRPVFNPETKSFGRQLFAKIASRTPTLDPIILDTLKNILSGYSIDMSKLKAVSHENC